MESHRQDETKIGGTRDSPPPPPPSSLLKVILLVDDDAEVRTLTKWFLSSLGYVLDAVKSAEEALVVFDPATHDLVVTDNRMPGMSGAELAHIIKMRSPTTPILMYTGLAPKDPSCVDLVLLKPSHFLTLRNAIAALLSAKPQ